MCAVHSQLTLMALSLNFYTSFIKVARRKTDMGTDGGLSIQQYIKHKPSKNSDAEHRKYRNSKCMGFII